MSSKLNGLSSLSDDDLARVIKEADRALFAAIEEANCRFEAKLNAAYGDELPFVSDIFAAVDRSWLTGRHEIIWCFYCGERPGWQREHKTPVSRGGGNGPDNIVPSCQTCNRRKAAMTLEEYREALQRRTGEPYVFSGERKK